MVVFARLVDSLSHVPVGSVDSHGLGGQSWTTPVGLSLLAGLSTALGALVVFALDGAPSKRVLAMCLSLAGAVMVWVSVEMAGPRLIAPAGASDFAEASGMLFLGAGIFVLIRRLLHSHVAKAPEPEAQELVGKETPEADARYWELGMLMFIVLTFHNFPEGMAVAASAIDSDKLGIIVAVAVAAHNIPEGIVIAVPVYAATRSRAKAFGYALASGLSEPVGAIVTVVCLQGIVTQRLLENLLCLVAGLMLGVSLVELFPDAYAYKEPLWAVGGALTGCAVMAVTSAIVE